NPAEAIRYYQAAVSIRPRAALGYFRLGSALSSTGRLEEAAEQFRRAVDTDATSGSQTDLAGCLVQLGRHDEAIDQLQAAARSHPNTAFPRYYLGHRLNFQGRHAEALAQYRQAVALDPKNHTYQVGLRTTLVLMGRAAEARVAWQKALEADPSHYDDWCEYAEFCLYLGRETDYCRTRQALLSRCGSTTSLPLAPRTARACFLRPAPGDGLGQAVALAERAGAAPPSKSPRWYRYFLSARARAEPRGGRSDGAASGMRGEAARTPGRAPRLVLAMALH